MKIDKHNKNEVYWLVEDIYDGLKHFKHFKRDCNWLIQYEPVSKFSAPYEHPERIKDYILSMERGDIFQPVVYVNGSEIIDGRHKVEAAKRIGMEHIPTARPAEGKSGIVLNDEVYEPLREGIVPEEKPGEIRCIRCTKTMQQRRTMLICDCGKEVIYMEVLGWTVING